MWKTPFSVDIRHRNISLNLIRRLHTHVIVYPVPYGLVGEKRKYVIRWLFMGICSQEYRNQEVCWLQVEGQEKAMVQLCKYLWPGIWGVSLVELLVLCWRPENLDFLCLRVNNMGKGSFKTGSEFTMASCIVSKSLIELWMPIHPYW